MNDKISSARCDGECAVLVFEHREYQGQTRLYDGSQQFLTNFGDKMSSTLVLMQRLCVTLYEHQYYRGRSCRYCSDVDSFSSGWHDRVSSLKVECTDCSVIVYEHPNYKGDYKAFMGNIGYVGNHWNDMISSIQIRPWKLPNVKQKSQRSCVDPAEKKAHDVIQWIPLLSTIYSLTSSAVYGAKGCDSVAKERAKDMAIGLATDIGIALTGGVLGAGLKAGTFCIKVGMKLGIKAGAKTAGQALKSTTKNALKNSRKIGSRGITVNAKAVGKSLMQEVKNIVTTTQTVAQVVKTGTKKTSRAVKDGVRKIGRATIDARSKGIGQGLKKAGTKAANKIKTAIERKFDDLADSTQRQIDVDKQISYSKLCRRRKRTPGKRGCPIGREIRGQAAKRRQIQKSRLDKEKVNDVAEEHLDDTAQGIRRQIDEGGSDWLPDFSTSRDHILAQRQLRASNRALKRRHEAENLFKEINKQNVKKMKGGKVNCIEYTFAGSGDVKENLRKLAFYDNYIKRNPAKGTLYPLEVHMTISDQPFEFTMKNARRGDKQIYIEFVSDWKPTYENIIENLDGVTPARRRNIAKAILDSVKAPRGNKKDYMHFMTPRERQAVNQLIVLTHVAEGAVAAPKQLKDYFKELAKPKLPNTGRVAGIDKVARAHLRHIADDREHVTFRKIFNRKDGEFIPARDGGTGKARRAYYKSKTARKEKKNILEKEKKFMSESSEYTSKRSEDSSESSDYTSESSDYTSESSDYTSESSDYTSESSDYTSESSDYTSESSDYTSESSDYTSESSDYTSESSDYTSESSDYTSEALTTHLKALTTHLKALTTHLKARSKCLKGLMTRLKAMRTQRHFYFSQKAGAT